MVTLPGKAQTRRPAGLVNGVLGIVNIIREDLGDPRGIKARSEARLDAKTIARSQTDAPFIAGEGKRLTAAVNRS